MHYATERVFNWVHYPGEGEAEWREDKGRLPAVQVGHRCPAVS